MTQNMVQDAAVTSKAALLSPPLFYLSLQTWPGLEPQRWLGRGSWCWGDGAISQTHKGVTLGPLSDLCVASGFGKRRGESRRAGAQVGGCASGRSATDRGGSAGPGSHHTERPVPAARAPAPFGGRSKLLRLGTRSSPSGPRLSSAAGSQPKAARGHRSLPAPSQEPEAREAVTTPGSSTAQGERPSGPGTVSCRALSTLWGAKWGF